MTSVAIPRSFFLARKITLPSDWAEVTRMQCIYFIRLLFMYGTGQNTIGSYSIPFQFQYLQACLGLAESKFYRLTDYQVTLLLYKMKSLFSDLCTVPAIKKLTYKLTSYYFPEANFKNVSFIEFALAEIYYRQILTGADPAKYLTLLTALLAKPHHKGKRIQHSDEQLEAKAKAFEKVAIEYKHWAFFYFHGVLTGLQTQYPNVFTTTERHPEPVEGLSDDSSNQGFLPAINILAESGVFGTWAATAHTNMHLVLHYMHDHHTRMKQLHKPKPLSPEGA